MGYSSQNSFVERGMSDQRSAVRSQRSHSEKAASRDQRLDFWRGLCLIDMLLVHLYFEPGIQFGNFLGRFLGDYTRFAAGGFIFISGLSIGVIFIPRAARPDKRSGTYHALWRRSVYILGVHYLCAMGLSLLTILFTPNDNFTNPFIMLRDIFLLRDGGDLLPFYVLMVAMSPLLIEALRRKNGWIGVLATSLVLYIYGMWHPWALALAQHAMFPPILWQAIFVLGLLLGSRWEQYNAIATKWKAWMAVGAWVVVGALFINEWGFEFGMGQFSFGTAYMKVPLSTPEALRYLSIMAAIMTTSDVFWGWISQTSAAAFVQTLGRKSLPVYAFHLWLVKALGALAIQWSFMGSWQILFAVFALLALWLWALILDVSKESKRAARPKTIPSLFGPQPMPGGAQ
jgi:hypothetical protein